MSLKCNKTSNIYIEKCQRRSKSHTTSNFKAYIKGGRNYWQKNSTKLIPLQQLVENITGNADKSAMMALESLI